MQRFRESRLYFPKKSFPTSFLWMCLCVCVCVNVNSIARLFRLSVCLYKNVCEPSHVHVCSVFVCVCVCALLVSLSSPLMDFDAVFLIAK